MSSKYKVNSVSSKTSSCRFTTSRASTGKSTKSKVVNPKRVLPSKKVPQNSSNHGKAHSAGYINDTRKVTKPKKNTKSEFIVRKPSDEVVDFCKKCGDTSTTKIEKQSSSDSSNKNLPRPATRKNNQKPIQQYYKNENYQPSTESIEDLNNAIKKISLDTIKEVSEIHHSDSIYKIYPDSEEEITYLDTEDQDSLQQLKDFRQKNYFECHSANSRIKHRGSATSLQEHRCVYRFYLNDRLFPVPLSTDHNNQVRCVECHLPMELNVDETTKINGTIQAKVTLGKKTQDVMLLLPVKQPLIITEKRKEVKKEKQVVYFGLINLDGFGNSVFNSTLPSNSFALKYQRGYKEYDDKEDYSYRDLDKTDVIVI